ncbi:MAG: peptidase MA family metallohydrolase [Candidatus Omnitrophica bacterium]|nr:peptidase MA family metallohydrolase [Candidatus Omnitrophota bacterium]
MKESVSKDPQGLVTGKVCFIVLGFAVFFLGNGFNGLATDDDKKAVIKELNERQQTEIERFVSSAPERANLPMMPIAAELYNEAVSYFQHHDYELAKKSLKESMRYDKRNPLAYELLGEIEYLKNRLKGAKRYYRQAYLIHPTKSVKEKIEKINKEVPLDVRFSTMSTKNFILKYQGEKKLGNAQGILDLLEQNYEMQTKDFGYHFKQPVIVLLYDTDEFQKITKSPFWVSGIYDGKIRLPVYEPAFGDAALNGIIAHEMAHVFVSVMSQNKAPSWIHEGLAIYEENKVSKKDLTLFETAVETNSLLPLEQILHESKPTDQDPLYANLFYEESFCFVEFLIKRFGMFKVEQLLSRYGKGGESSEAMDQVFGKSIMELEKEWRSTVIK